MIRRGSGSPLALASFRFSESWRGSIAKSSARVSAISLLHFLLRKPFDQFRLYLLKVQTNKFSDNDGCSTWVQVLQPSHVTLVEVNKVFTQFNTMLIHF